MLKIRLFIALIIILVCIPSMHYTYAQPAPETEQSDTSSSENNEESQKEQQLEEMQQENNRMDQQSMEQLNDNS